MEPPKRQPSQLHKWVTCLIIHQNDAHHVLDTWLRYGDLDVNNQGFPQEYANLTKGSNVPSVNGGILWPDGVNKVIYLYGGEYAPGSPPDSFDLWFYDIIYNTWNVSKPSTSDPGDIQRASYGAGTIDDVGRGYYYGGWLSSANVPGWNGPAVALSNMLTYDMIKKAWTNSSGPDSTPRAEGVMLYIPASDAGMLVYFGGVQAPSNNGSWIGVGMENILIYDIANQKWYSQTATGQVPAMRRRFCAGATWAEDRSSYNMCVTQTAVALLL